MTAQADQTPPSPPTLTLRENICEFFVKNSSSLTSSFGSTMHTFTLCTVYTTYYTVKKHILIPLSPDMLFRGYFASSTKNVLFWKPWLVYEMVRHGWLSVSGIEPANPPPPPPTFLCQLDLDWHSLLLISSHGHGIITIFITYHHHLSSSSRNLTTCFNRSTQPWGKVGEAIPTQRGAIEMGGTRTSYF